MRECDTRKSSTRTRTRACARTRTRTTLHVIPKQQANTRTNLICCSNTRKHADTRKPEFYTRAIRAEAHT